jgi:hypothetical protein
VASFTKKNSGTSFNHAFTLVLFDGKLYAVDYSVNNYSGALTPVFLPIDAYLNQIQANTNSSLDIAKHLTVRTLSLPYTDARTTTKDEFAANLAAYFKQDAALQEAVSTSIYSPINPNQEALKAWTIKTQGGPVLGTEAIDFESIDEKLYGVIGEWNHNQISDEDLITALKKATNDVATLTNTVSKKNLNDLQGYIDLVQKIDSALSYYAQIQAHFQGYPPESYVQAFIDSIDVLREKTISLYNDTEDAIIANLISEYKKTTKQIFKEYYLKLQNAQMRQPQATDPAVFMPATLGILKEAERAMEALDIAYSSAQAQLKFGQFSQYAKDILQSEIDAQYTSIKDSLESNADGPYYNHLEAIQTYLIQETGLKLNLSSSSPTGKSLDALVGAITQSWTSQDGQRTFVVTYYVDPNTLNVSNFSLTETNPAAATSPTTQPAYRRGATNITAAQREELTYLTTKYRPDLKRNLSPGTYVHEWAEELELTDPELAAKVKANLAQLDRGGTTQAIPELEAELVNYTKALAALYKVVLVREIGRGGNGLVWEAFDSLGDLKAIKFGYSPIAEKSIDHERAILRSANSISGIIKASDTKTSGIMITEQFTGGTLEDFLADIERNNAVLPPEAVMRLAAELALVLEEVRNAGIRINDLKPENIGIRDGRLILFDMGGAYKVATTNKRTQTTSPAIPFPFGKIITTVDYATLNQRLDGISDDLADYFAFSVIVRRMMGGQNQSQFDFSTYSYVPFDKTNAILRVPPRGDDSYPVLDALQYATEAYAPRGGMEYGTVNPDFVYLIQNLIRSNKMAVNYDETNLQEIPLTILFTDAAGVDVTNPNYTPYIREYRTQLSRP